MNWASTEWIEVWCPRHRLSAVACLVLLVSSDSAISAARVARQESFDLDGLLDKALGESLRYADVFQNLTAEERQERVILDDEGRVSERRTIVSDFVVFRSALDVGTTAEYRSIRLVDGEPLEDSDDRERVLTADLSNVETVEEELARIREENNRFDIGFQYNGLSLGTSQPPYRNREVFDIEIARRETANGRDWVLVRYRQTMETPRIRLNIRGFPDQVEFRWRGMLWLDDQTGELWRVEEEVVAEGFRREPVVLMRHEKQYRESPFGILVPARFEYTVFKPDDFAIGDRTTVEYGPFRRFAVDVEIQEPLIP